MERYLQYLHADIEALIEQAPLSQEKRWPPPYFEEDDMPDIPLRMVKICDLIGLPAEAFPPENRLTDLQVIELVESIDDLWTSWLLHWEIPFNLPLRKQYTALVKEFNGAPIAYHPEDGGEIHICQFHQGKECPFQPNDSHCNCREMEESAKHDIALWEEYVHSQGLDPYREMTEEEEALFEKEMRQRDLKKRFGDNWWLQDADMEIVFGAEMDEEEQLKFLHALEVADELLSMILDNLSDSDPDSSLEEEEDFDLPF